MNIGDIEYEPNDLQNFLQKYSRNNFGKLFEMELMVGMKSEPYSKRTLNAPEEFADMPVEYVFIVKRINQKEIFSRYFHRIFEVKNVYFTKVEYIENDVQRFLDTGFTLMDQADYEKMLNHSTTKVIQEYLTDKKSFFTIL